MPRYLIRENWKDGEFTINIISQVSEVKALWIIDYNYAAIKTVLDLDGPESYQCLGTLDSTTEKNYWQPTKTSRKRYWHDAISITSLTKRVQILKKLENPKG